MKDGRCGGGSQFSCSVACWARRSAWRSAFSCFLTSSRRRRRWSNSPRPERGELVAKGTFIQPNPNDPIHYGKGEVSVYAGTVFLGEDFEVGPGPDFHVYLVPKADIRSSSDVGDTMFVDLGRLRAFKGSQKYAIPAGVDLAKFPSVVIWCQQFSVLISPADLTFEPSS
jgi:hypothetical protein